MTRRILLVATLVVAGCGTVEGGPAQLEVQMLSVGGDLSGRPLDGAAASTLTGERFGDQGTFFVEGPSLSLQLSACPLGSLDVDPYGLGGGDPRGGPVPVPEDAGLGSDPGASTGGVTGVDCIGRSLSLCHAGDCGQFTASEIELQIVEEDGWRHVTADANGGSGSVRVELLYRETH